jgi:hypothetical protein
MPTGDHFLQLQQLQPVTSRLTSMVDVVGKVLRPAALIGLVATAVIALALTPWLFHSTVAAVVWCVLVVVGAGAALRLLWHARLLRRTLGTPEFVAQSLTKLNEVGREHAQRLAPQLDELTHADEGTKARTAFKMLRDLRNLSAFREIGEAANEIVAPVSAPRLVWSGYAVGIVMVATFLAVPVALASLVGLLLR